MGYTTDFNGQITVEPPLDKKEIAYLQKFSKTRRMNRKNGPYYVEGKGDFGQDRENDIINYNQPPEGQPGLWCQWIPTDEGRCIEWDGSEKFYDAAEWMKYIIEHFLKPDPIAGFPFLKGHVCNGEIHAQGEENDDKWLLIVENNVVKVAHALEPEYGMATPV